MKKNTLPLFSFIIGLVLVAYAIFMDGGNLQMFWSISSILITLCGSLAALFICYPFRYIKTIPSVLKKLFIESSHSKGDLVVLFTDLARKARKEGLLSLEDDIALIDDHFLQKGLQMVVDGVEPETIDEIMKLEIDAVEERHKHGENIFRTWGNLAPAFGMVGTLIGLIIMLSNLEDIAAIGAGMATALITTFYGTLLANLVFIPIANNLRTQTDEELFAMEMIIDGVLALQSGVNPRIVEEKLMAYLSPKERQKRIELAEKAEMVIENE
jgi:chemotaxis protein MotA